MDSSDLCKDIIDELKQFDHPVRQRELNACLLKPYEPTTLRTLLMQLRRDGYVRLTRDKYEYWEVIDVSQDVAGMFRAPLCLRKVAYFNATSVL